MELLQENEYCKIIYNDKDEMVEFTWKEASDDLEDDGFKSLLLELTDILKQKKANSFFTDASNKKYIINDEIQEWHDEVIVPMYIQAGIKQIAFYVADSSVVDIAIELTFDEKNSQKLQTRFFDSETEAKAWLNEQNQAA